MALNELVNNHLSESIRTKQRLLEQQADAIVAAGTLCGEALKAGRKILFCGNGGSAADSQHLATELVVRLSKEFERPALAAIALTTDTSLITACANDYSFDEIFSRQVEGLGSPGDVLIGITTSGNSGNVKKALEVARVRGLKTLLLSAGEGGECAPLADQAVLVPSDVTSHVQESHIAIGHLLCEIVERVACGRPD